MPDSETFPVKLTFRDIEPSPAVEARIRKQAERLTNFYDRIMGCRVVVSAPERRHHRQRLYSVRLQIVVPGGNLWINRGSKLDRSHADMYVAIRDAFAAATRRLEDHARRLDQRIKSHDAVPYGKVTTLDARRGYGMIETPGGDEVYFHKNSVLDAAFKRLKPGALVRYVLASNGEGQNPRASTVRLIGKHHPTRP